MKSKQFFHIFLVALIGVLTVGVISQSILIRKIESETRKILQYSENYRSYIGSTFYTCMTDDLQDYLDNLRESKSELVAVVPPAVCTACFMSFLLYLDEAQINKDDVHLFLADDALTSERMLKVKGFDNVSYIKYPELMTDETSILLSRVEDNGWRMRYLSYTDGMDAILELFLK